MADPRSPAPELLVVAAFSRHLPALEWAKTRLQATYGPVALTSPPYPFDQTDYYAATMGGDLRKQFFVFESVSTNQDGHTVCVGTWTNIVRGA